MYKISSVLASQRFVDHRLTVRRKLCKVSVKAYQPRKKPYLTEKMKASVEHGLSSTVTGLHKIGS